MRNYFNKFLFLAPAGEDGDDTGGGKGPDLGDDYVSPLAKAGKTDDDGETPEAKAAREAEEEKAKGDKDKGDKDETEETDEEKAEREAAEKKARIRIPKARYDEAQAKARQREQALMEQIQELKNGKASTEAQKSVSERKTKIDELQDKYEDLILDGKKDEARKVRKEVESLRDELVDYQTSVKSDAARKAAVEELTYDAKLASFEAQYPEMNPENAEFDEDKVNEIGDLLDAFVRKGTKRAEALAKAVKYVLGNPPVAADKGDKDKDPTKRGEDARKKAADADKRQPASTTKTGLSSDKGGKGAGETAGIDIMKLDQDKFAKLDEATLAKLRGDDV